MEIDSVTICKLDEQRTNLKKRYGAGDQGKSNKELYKLKHKEKCPSRPNDTA